MHPNFKNIFPDALFTSIDSIIEYMNVEIRINNTEEYDIINPFNHQDTFKKRTLPWETQFWNKELLESFKIKLEEIDRIYYIRNYYNSVWVYEFDLLFRINYKGSPLYVKMLAFCDYLGFSKFGVGSISVFFNPIYFMKCIDDKMKFLPQKYKNIIYQSLRDDIDLYQNNIYPISTLKHLCYENISCNNLLPHFTSTPPVLLIYIENFLKYQNDLKYFDYWEDDNREKDMILNVTNDWDHLLPEEWNMRFKPKVKDWDLVKKIYI